jgi:peptide/nickel transport system ATP-binding protein
VEGLSLDYLVPGGGMAVLRDIDLSVAPGEIVGLVGESGSGKSSLAFTLMRHMAANARFAGGRVVFEGVDLVTAAPAHLAALRGRRMAMLFQDPSTALNPAMRLGAQVAEGLRHHRGLNAAAAQTETEALLAAMNLKHPREIMRRFPHEVSGGEKQRVVLAMALAGDPALLVMDEPTTALDATTTAGILQLIRDLQRRRGLGVLYISHDLGNVARIADRVAVIYAGSIVEEGPTAAVLQRPAHVYTRMLIASLPNPARVAERRRLATFGDGVPDRPRTSAGCRFAGRCPLVEAACRSMLPVLAGTGPHRSACRRASEVAGFALPLTSPAAVAAAAGSAPVLVATDVSVTYRRQAAAAVSGISLSIAAGETLGLVGESGSGKSSFVRGLMGLAPASGRMLLEGREIASLAGLARRRIQMVFQHPEQSLNPAMPVGESLARPLALYEGLRGAKLSGAVTAWLEQVRLPAAYARRFPHELSGGEKQRVAIARAFAARPALVLCDEITTGLDATVQASVLNLLTDLQARDGTALLLISHDLNMVQHFADRIAVMHRGRLVELRPAYGLSPPPFHPYNELLLAAMPVVEPGILARPVLPRPEAPADFATPGCRFAGPCPRQPDARCNQVPPVRTVAESHWIRCHLSAEDLRRVPPIWSAPTLPNAATSPPPSEAAEHRLNQESRA